MPSRDFRRGGKRCRREGVRTVASAFGVEPNSLVWIGGFNNYPNYEAMRFFLAEVYPTVKRERENVRLYLVGAGAERLEALVGGDSSIVITGFVDNPVPFMQRASVFIAPILSGSGTKLKVLEAMAAGKAIVSTSIGVEGIAGRDGNHYLVADRPELFARRILDLLEHPALGEQLGTPRGRSLKSSTTGLRSATR